MSGREISASGRGHVVRSEGDVYTLHAQHEGVIEHAGGVVHTATANFGGRIILESGEVTYSISAYNGADFIGKGSADLVHVSNNSSAVVVGSPDIVVVDKGSSAVIFGEPHSVRVQNESSVLIATRDYEYLPSSMTYRPSGSLELLAPDTRDRPMDSAVRVAILAVFSALDELPAMFQYRETVVAYREMLQNCKLQIFTDDAQ